MKQIKRNFFEDESPTLRYKFRFYWIPISSLPLHLKIKFSVKEFFCKCKQNRLATVWKVSKYGFFSGPYFPVFGLNTTIYGTNLGIQSKYGKMRTRKKSVFGHVSAVYLFTFTKDILNGKLHFLCSVTKKFNFKFNFISSIYYELRKKSLPFSLYLFFLLFYRSYAKYWFRDTWSRVLASLWMIAKPNRMKNMKIWQRK